MSCSIPFINGNLCPLSFTDVVRDNYTAALLAIYELNNVESMLELFVSASQRRSLKHGYQTSLEQNKMAHPEGFEPPTKWFEATYSIQLSYGCIWTENDIKLY